MSGHRSLKTLSSELADFCQRRLGWSLVSSGFHQARIEKAVPIRICGIKTLGAPSPRRLLSNLYIVVKRWDIHAASARKLSSYFLDLMLEKALNLFADGAIL